MKILSLLFVPLFFFLQGCSTPTISYLNRPAFPYGEYRALPDPSSGSGKVHGQAFLRTVNGEVKTAAGYVAYLTPFTSANSWFWDNVVVRGYPVKQKTSDQGELVSTKGLTANCDADGRFSFTNVANGNYQISVPVIWSIPTKNGMEQQGGWVYRKIKVTNDNPIQNLVLTYNDANSGDPNIGYVDISLVRALVSAPVTE